MGVFSVHSDYFCIIDVHILKIPRLSAQTALVVILPALVVVIVAYHSVCNIACGNKEEEKCSHNGYGGAYHISCIGAGPCIAAVHFVFHNIVPFIAQTYLSEFILWQLLLNNSISETGLKA